MRGLRSTGQLLAELLRIQRWADSSNNICPGRIYALAHGFESVLKETRSSGIAEATERAVEALLCDVEAGKQPPDGLSIKERLRSEGISESAAHSVIEYFSLIGHLTEGISKLSGPGSIFAGATNCMSSEEGWFGALHYVELFDSTGEKLHAAMCPCVPRVGELVTPERGSMMRVVAVEHVAVAKESTGKGKYVHLIPHVTLEPIDEDEEEIGNTND